jgi:hypothetical protein
MATSIFDVTVSWQLQGHVITYTPCKKLIFAAILALKLKTGINMPHWLRFVSICIFLSASLSFRVVVERRSLSQTRFRGILKHSNLYLYPDTEGESGNSDEFKEILNEAASDVDENATETGEAGDAVDGDYSEGEDEKEKEGAEEEEKKSSFEMAIEEKEKELKKQIEETEKLLRKERVSNMRVKDKISESGKTGFFIVQAQVAEFLVSSLNLHQNFIRFCAFVY